VVRRTAFVIVCLALGVLPGRVEAQNLISVPFTNGFLGTRGSSAGSSNAVKTFATLGISRVFFIQNSSTNTFELQGNDIPGTMRVIRTDGTTLDMPASANWRNSGGTTYLIGILPRPASPVTLTYSGGSVQITDGTSPGGSSLGGYVAAYAGATAVDGDAMSGNAAQSQVLGGLNSYLSTVVASRPAGPVTVNTLSTSNTTPTITGTATLAAGENLSVVVNNVQYTASTTPAVVRSSNNWSLALTSPLALGTYPVTATITNADGFTLSDATTDELAITGAGGTVTIGGSFTANGKTYDGTTTATGTTSGLTLVGVNSGHTVTIASVTLAFGSAAAGTGKTVTITGVTLGGADAGLYTVSLAGAPTATAAITAKALTIGGVTATSRTYDGTTAAALSGTPSYAGLASGESFTVSGTPSASFGTAAVGTGKSVTVTGYTAPNANYTVSQPTGLTANVTAKGATVGGSFTASDKTFDGTTAVTIATNALTVVGGVAGETLSLTGVTAAFADAAVGTGKTVSLSAATLGGATAANYTLSLAGAPTTTANITSAGGTVTIAGTFTANDKVYDGTTTAAGTTSGLTLSGVTAPDQVSIASVTLAFQSAAAGTGKTVVVTAVTLGGADAAHYTVSLAGAPTATAAVTPKALTIGGSFAAADKPYDGTTAATISTNALAPSGVVSGDAVTLAGVTVAFATPAVGTAKPVTITAAGLGGAAASNYTLGLAGAPSTTASITSVGGTVTIAGAFTASDKTYDGTTTAAGSTAGLTLAGVTAPDQVSIASVTLAFQSAAAGAGKTVVITGVTLGGADAARYAVSLAGAPTATAAVTPRALTIGGGFGAADKTFDGTAAATITTNALTLVGPVGGDAVSLTGVSAAFANATVGTAKPVALSAASLTGAAAGNYALSLAGAPTTTASITSAGGTVTIAGTFTASDKTYDGAAAAAGTTSGLTLAGVTAPDQVTIASVTLAFQSAAAGAGKTVTITGVTLGGADAARYTTSLAGAPTATATIAPKALAIGGVGAANKVYDGTTAATLTGTPSYTGLVAGESFPVAGTPAAHFATAAVGPNKPVTVAGYLAPNGNYTVAQPAGLTAGISPRPVSIGGQFSAADKVYDGSAAATISANGLTVVGLVSGEAVSLTGIGAAFASPEVGAGKAVTLTGATLGGPAAPNYALSLAGAPTTTASIVAASPPTAPRTVSTTAGDGSATVTWTIPEGAGCRAVTGFVVEYSGDGGRTWSRTTAAATATSATLAGLTNNVAYQVRVAAVNACGTGAFAVASSVVVPIGPTRDATGTPTTAAPGSASGTTGGVAQPVTTEVVQDTVIRVTGGDFSLRLRATDQPGNAIPIDSSRTLVLEHGGRARADGGGFAPSTVVSLFLVNAARQSALLGTAPVAADGTFSTAVPVADTLAAGSYTLQLIGIDRGAVRRSLSLGVDVEPPAAQLDLTSTPDQSSPAVGDTITITLTVTNTGRGAATDVVIPRAFHEPGFTIVRTTPVDGRYDASKQEWTIDRIDPGARARMLLTVVVLPPTAPQGATP
jgi:hypothetical protein